MPTNLYWNADTVNQRLATALKTLGEEYPIRQGPGTPALVLAQGEPGRNLTVRRQGETYTVIYGTHADAMRGVGTVLADLPADAGKTIKESCPFTTLGIMLDCSRNAVMTVEHVKGWLRKLALMGYNMVMLYTEDTYQLPGEPFFGYLRGAYTPEELREMDEYASRLDIELIGCIQTLGHLEQILKWNVYGPVKDTGSVLLADEPASYELITKMIETYATCFRSRRIHVGMDEAHDIGRGRYLDLHGYRRGFDILNDHLGKVLGICNRFGVKPMIWSDMFFRLGSKTHEYYDLKAVIPEDVIKGIPDVELVYWDYYHGDDDTYLKMIEIHRQMKREPIMASGVWTWSHLWYGQGITERAGGACIRASRQAKLKEVFFTMWGDDGGYCEYDSALAGLAWAAEQAYGVDDLEALRERYEAICGVDYDHVLLGSRLHDQTLGNRVDETNVILPVQVLWDDPLLGIHHLIMKARKKDFWKHVSEHYHQVESDLSPHIGRSQPVDLDHALTLAKFLAAKVDFRMALEGAYQARDRGRMQMLLPEVGRIVELLEQLQGTFRRQWYRKNKPFGFEVVQIRLAGLRERYREIARLLSELMHQQRSCIPELDEGLGTPKEVLEKLQTPGNYRRLATASSIL